MAGSGGGYGRLIAGAVIALAVLLLLRTPIANAWRTRSFPPGTVASFAAIDYPRGEGSVGDQETPYRSGKVLIVKRAVLDHRQVSEIDPPAIVDAWYDLPGSIRASRPEEVRTLMICDTGLGTVGFYTPVGKAPSAPSASTKAKRRWVRLIVYDLEKKIRVGEATLNGGMPRDLIKAGESKIGEPADVVGFVTGMPAR